LSCITSSNVIESDKYKVGEKIYMITMTSSDSISPKPNDKFQQTLSQLLEYITQNNLLPGQKLPTEKVLCQRLAVGRSVVREVVRALVVAGVLKTQQGSGIYVSEKSTDISVDVHLSIHSTYKDISDLYVFRSSLECETAALAAEHISHRQMQHLQKVSEDYLRAATRGSIPDLQELDPLFHLCIAESSHNSLFKSAVGAIHRLHHGILDAFAFEIPDAVMQSAQEHNQIVSAIQNSDPESARAAMKRHIDSSFANYQSSYTLWQNHKHGVSNKGSVNSGQRRFSDQIT
jgi:GntR family transcriptional regulator, transcriptional repressor for pyruvate dehydrogenase complex